MNVIVNDIELPIIPKLQFLLAEPADYKILYGGRGGGKCLKLGTRVIMYDGTLRSVEDIREGELVMGPDNRPRKVTGTTRGRSMMYRVKQTSGIEYVVNDAHILSLKKSNSAINDIGEISAAGNARRPKGRYGSWPIITNINVVEAMGKSARWKSNFRGYRAGKLDFSDKAVTIDPWFLGLWLGDGNSGTTQICSMDEEIIEECRKYATSLGLNLRIGLQKNNRSKMLSLSKIPPGTRANKLRDRFKQYNLISNKHIPNDYLTGNEKTRLEVLAGLIDSDGYLHDHNYYEIIQTNEKLAREIKYLADTLGFRTKFRKKITKCSNNGVIGEAWKLSICGDIWRVPCRLSRKRAKKENINPNKDYLLSYISIEEDGEGDYAGFSLDGDHLFLLEDGTVTHNTLSLAQAALILGSLRPLRVGCFREFQKSIKESVHETLKQEVERINLLAPNGGPFYTVGETSITGVNGTEFFFMGLRHNLNSLKSVANIDIAWVEEAATISKTAWDVFLPTIRRDPPFGPFGRGSEIWISFNPELDTDETYKRFVLNPPAGSIVMDINYYDNPFFPEILRRQMEDAKKRGGDDYDTVWGGKPRNTVDGAIYSRQLAAAKEEGRITDVPWDKSKPVVTYWDLGKRDHTSVWFVQPVGMWFNIIDFYEQTGADASDMVRVLQSKPYNYGIVWLPHDGENETAVSHRNYAGVLRSAGFRVRLVDRVAKKHLSIQASRVIFDQCRFDRERTYEGLQRLRRYKYELKDGNYTRDPLHDLNSDAADAFQQLGLHQKAEDEIIVKKKRIPQSQPPVSAGLGWMT